MKLDRPAVDELLFQLYGRPLHPELFDIAAVERVSRPDFEAEVRLTRGGHVISWTPRREPKFFLTEVVNPAQPWFPPGPLAEASFRHERMVQAQPHPGVRYQACFQLEVLTPEVFCKVNDELLRDARRRGFIHYFAPGEGYGPAPIGLILMDGRPGCQLVHAFHTFPDECTVVKSQSLFEHDLT